MSPKREAELREFLRARLGDEACEEMFAEVDSLRIQIADAQADLRGALSKLTAEVVKLMAEEDT